MLESEILISVDIEASGPITPDYSMLSLGACLVNDTRFNFYEEFKPLNDNFQTEAMENNDLSLETLKQTGINPGDGMLEFDKWISNVSPKNRPLMLSFNNAFDWQFVNYYFHKFLGRNPLGIGCLDIKTYYMGKFNTTFGQTSKSKFPKIFLPENQNRHNALSDAIEQAEIYKRIRNFEGTLVDAHQKSDLLKLVSGNGWAG